MAPTALGASCIRSVPRSRHSVSAVLCAPRGSGPEPGQPSNPSRLRRWRPHRSMTRQPCSETPPPTTVTILQHPAAACRPTGRSSPHGRSVEPSARRPRPLDAAAQRVRHRPRHHPWPVWIPCCRPMIARRWAAWSSRLGSEDSPPGFRRSGNRSSSRSVLNQRLDQVRVADSQHLYHQ